MNIFVNEQDRRPRAGWRLLLQFLIFLLFILLFGTLQKLLMANGLKVYQAITMCAAGLASFWIAAVLLDKRSVGDFGLSWSLQWQKELAAGLAMGASAIGLIFLLSWAADWITISGWGWERTSDIPYALWFLSYFIAMILIGFYEEVLFRGYHILNLMDGFRSAGKNLKLPVTIAIAASSVFFGLLHAGNPNASLISTANIMLAGIILAIPYLITGSLGISVGMHISWNLFQGGIFGFPVSGTPFRGSLIQIQQEGSDWITGGRFGPEAGMLGILGIAIMIALFILWCRYSGIDWGLSDNFQRVLSNSGKTDEQG